MAKQENELNLNCDGLVVTESKGILKLNANIIFSHYGHIRLFNFFCVYVSHYSSLKNNAQLSTLQLMG